MSGSGIPRAKTSGEKGDRRDPREIRVWEDFRSDGRPRPGSMIQGRGRDILDP